MEHNHNIYDSDPHFKIDPISRKITKEPSAKTTLIQGDHNSERFTFNIAKMVEGHDMSQSTRIEVHFINMDGNEANRSEDVYIIDDLHTSEDDDNVLIFSWLLSGNATRYAGTLAFAIRFICTTGEKIDYAWHTAPYKGISITECINVFEKPDSGSSGDTSALVTRLLNLEDRLAKVEDNLEKWTAYVGDHIDNAFGNLKSSVNELDRRVKALEGK